MCVSACEQTAEKKEGIPLDMFGEWYVCCVIVFQYIVLSHCNICFFSPNVLLYILYGSGYFAAKSILEISHKYKEYSNKAKSIRLNWGVPRFLSMPYLWNFYYRQTYCLCGCVKKARKIFYALTFFSLTTSNM